MIGRDGYYYYPRNKLSYNKYVDIRAKLINICPWKKTKKYGSSPWNVWKQTKKYIVIPRNYGISVCGNVTRSLLYPGDIVVPYKLNSNIILRDYQMDAVNAVQNAYNDDNIWGGMLVLPTGSGKTITSLYIANLISTRTLIVVNTKSLARQWCASIKQLFNIDAIIISELSTSTNINKIILTNNFIITVVNSLKLTKSGTRRFPSPLFKTVGLVIIDEVHSMISPSILTIFRSISRKFILGLTATPDRCDNLDFLYEYFIGDILYRKKFIYTGQLPLVHFYNYKNNNYTTIVTHENKSINYTATVKKIYEDPHRMNLAVNIIKKYNTMPSINKIIVVAPFRDILESLYARVKEFEPSSGLYYSTSSKRGIEKQLSTIRTAKIIISIFSLAKQSLDIKDCNCIILLSSPILHITSSGEYNTTLLDQIVGRILRKNHTTTPHIIIINDMWGFFASHARLRKIYFRDYKKWKIINESY